MFPPLFFTEEDILIKTTEFFVCLELFLTDAIRQRELSLVLPQQLLHLKK